MLLWGDSVVSSCVFTEAQKLAKSITELREIANVMKSILRLPILRVLSVRVARYMS